jgi:hypothetical protein
MTRPPESDTGSVIGLSSAAKAKITDCSSIRMPGFARGRAIIASLSDVKSGAEAYENTPESPVNVVSEAVKVDSAAILGLDRAKIARSRGSSDLLTLKQAAARLCITSEQTMEFVADGKLKWINVGRGKVRPRYRFAETDLGEFIEQRTTREAPKSCLFSKSRARKTTVTMAGSKVIGLEELRRQRTDAKLKK